MALSGCGSVGYYAQAVRGGAGVLLARRSIDRLLADPTTPEPLAGKLRLVQEVRRFAADELALEPGGAFRHYADLGRSHAVWNVVAAPELALEPKVWCFPVAGCVSYRGYFREEAARRYAAQLDEEGWDVAVLGASAYSTLGWFDDPVLSTFIDLPEPQLAGLLLHELAHRVVYVKDDTTFNESFATAVEEVGVSRWLESGGRGGEVAAYEETQRRERSFIELVLEHREGLAVAYAAAPDDEGRRRAKRRGLAELEAAYRELRADWGEGRWYDGWFEEGPNHAHLVSLGAYHELTPAFRHLLEASSGWPAFFAAVRELADLPPSERRARLVAVPEKAG